MTFLTQQYVRRPFPVEAVRVTRTNMAEVAVWCGGEIVKTDPKPGKPSANFIQVRVLRPMNARQTKAFAGDWILKAGSSFKVYMDKAFREGFDPFQEQMELAPGISIMEDHNYGKVLDGPESQEWAQKVREAWATPTS